MRDGDGLGDGVQVVHGAFWRYPERFWSCTLATSSHLPGLLIVHAYLNSKASLHLLSPHVWRYPERSW